MKYAWMVIGLILLTSGLFAQEAGDDVAQLLVKGDEYFDAFDNAKALESYLAAYNADNTNCEALWKITRTYADLGEVAEKDEQAKLYEKAESFGRKAIATCPDDGNAHLQLAIAVGRVAVMAGGKTKVKLSKEVKAEALKALELDPTLDGAHHVLGRWHRGVANLSGLLKMFAKVLYGGLPPASNEDAVKHFKKAIELKPEHINHHLELGITYEMMKEWANAKASYEKVLELPVSDADDDAHKREAKERLKKVEKKLK